MFFTLWAYIFPYFFFFFPYFLESNYKKQVCVKEKHPNLHNYQLSIDLKSLNCWRSAIKTSFYCTILTAILLNYQLK